MPLCSGWLVGSLYPFPADVARRGCVTRHRNLRHRRKRRPCATQQEEGSGDTVGFRDAT
jgi:hypothetical protein